MTINAIGLQAQALHRMALRFLQGYLHDKHDGETVVLAFSKKSSQPIAFAAGLANESQRTQFVILARYVFSQNDIDRYAVMAPAWLGPNSEQKVVATQVCVPGGCFYSVSLQNHADSGRFTNLEPGPLEDQGQPMLEDLLQANEPMPGIMRRKLDGLFGQIRIDPSRYLSDPERSGYRI